jgi:hypothetical protein
MGDKEGRTPPVIYRLEMKISAVDKEGNHLRGL